MNTPSNFFILPLIPLIAMPLAQAPSAARASAPDFCAAPHGEAAIAITNGTGPAMTDGRDSAVIKDEGMAAQSAE